MNAPVRWMASFAVWSIALVIARQLRHPLVYATVGTLAISVSILIWSDRQRPPKP